MRTELSINQLKNIEQNEIVFFAHHRSKRTMHPHALLLVSPYPEITIWNFAGAINCAESEVEALIEDVEAHFQSHEQMPSFRINQLTRPPLLEELLIERGYSVCESMSSMILDSKYQSPVIPNEIDVRVMKSDEEIAQFTRVQIDGFGGSPGSQWDDWFLDTNLRNSQREDHTFYLAEYEGRAAGVSLAIYTTSGVCGIYAVATLEEYRKIGVARALFAHVIADARESGHDLITLSTALDGPAERVFGRLGFERVLETRYLVRESLLSIDEVS